MLHDSLQDMQVSVELPKRMTTPSLRSTSNMATREVNHYFLSPHAPLSPHSSLMRLVAPAYHLQDATQTWHFKMNVPRSPC